MNCEQVESWLLMSDTPGTLPSSVVRHLADCPRCEEVRRGIISLESNKVQLPVEAELAKRNFLSRLDELPEQEIETASQPALPLPPPIHVAQRSSGNVIQAQRSFWMSTPAGMVIAAAALLIAFGLGWLVSRANAPSYAENIQPNSAVGNVHPRTDDAAPLDDRRDRSETSNQSFDVTSGEPKDLDQPVIAQNKDTLKEIESTPIEGEQQQKEEIAANNPPEISPAVSHPDIDEVKSEQPEITSAANPEIEKTRETQAIDSQQIAGLSRSELAILNELIENHVQLANVSDARQSMQLIAETAGIIWDEIVRQVETKPTRDLDNLATLYCQVLDNGLAPQANSVSKTERASVSKISVQLRQRASRASLLSKRSVPAFENVLRSTGECSELVASNISRGKTGDALIQLDEIKDSDDLITNIVYQSLKMTSDPDPLVRADYSSRVAEQLSKKIVFTSLNDDEVSSEKLSNYLGQVYDGALLPNLAKFEPAGKNDPRLKQYEEIVNRGESALAALQQNLDRAPEAARAGLLRALEAQNNRLQRGHGKGNNPVFKNPNGFVPPGQRKKQGD